jgi:hypothetical protein
MIESTDVYRDPEFEQKVRAAFAVPEPDPSFIAHLQVEISKNLETQRIQSREPGKIRAESGRTTRWRALFSSLAGGTAFLVFVLVLIWIINNLIPTQTPGVDGHALPNLTRSTIASSERKAVHTPAITGSPSQTPISTVASTPANIFSANYKYAQTHLTFQWDGSEDLQYPDPFKGEIYSDQVLLGRVDFGALPGGLCDRSWDGQIVAYSYDGPVLTGERSNPTLRFFSLENVNTIYMPLEQYALQSPASFAPDDFRIAFNACSSSGECGMFVYKIETGQIKKLSSIGFWKAPLWSPDGEQIIVQVPTDESKGIMGSQVSVFEADNGILVYSGRADAPDSPMLNLDLSHAFEVTGSERCEKPLQR